MLLLRNEEETSEVGGVRKREEGVRGVEKSIDAVALGAVG